MSKTKEFLEIFRATALWLQKSFQRAVTLGGDIGQKQRTTN